MPSYGLCCPVQPEPVQDDKQATFYYAMLCTVLKKYKRNAIKEQRTIKEIECTILQMYCNVTSLVYVQSVELTYTVVRVDLCKAFVCSRRGAVDECYQAEIFKNFNEAIPIKPVVELTDTIWSVLKILTYLHRPVLVNEQTNMHHDPYIIHPASSFLFEFQTLPFLYCS